MSPEESFIKELEVFRRAVQGGTQLLFAYLAIHATASKSKPTHRALNESPLFWNTVMGGLQQSAFITLGRIFDQTSTHNVDALLRIAQQNPDVFSKEAL